MYVLKCDDQSEPPLLSNRLNKSAIKEWKMSRWDKMTNQFEVAVRSWTFADDVMKA